MSNQYHCCDCTYCAEARISQNKHRYICTGFDNEISPWDAICDDFLLFANGKNKHNNKA